MKKISCVECSFFIVRDLSEINKGGGGGDFKLKDEDDVTLPRDENKIF